MATPSGCNTQRRQPGSLYCQLVLALIGFRFNGSAGEGKSSTTVALFDNGTSLMRGCDIRGA
jgi:hypothetical protein